MSLQSLRYLRASRATQARRLPGSGDAGAFLEGRASGSHRPLPALWEGGGVGVRCAPSPTLSRSLRGNAPVASASPGPRDATHFVPGQCHLSFSNAPRAQSFPPGEPHPQRVPHALRTQRTQRGLLSAPVSAVSGLRSEATPSVCKLSRGLPRPPCGKAAS